MQTFFDLRPNWYQSVSSWSASRIRWTRDARLALTQSNTAWGLDEPLYVLMTTWSLARKPCGIARISCDLYQFLRSHNLWTAHCTVSKTGHGHLTGGWPTGLPQTLTSPYTTDVMATVAACCWQHCWHWVKVLSHWTQKRPLWIRSFQPVSWLRTKKHSPVTER